MDALENLEVWRRSCRLSVSLYKSLSQCSDFGFRDQITRSGLSVAWRLRAWFKLEAVFNF